MNIEKDFQALVAAMEKCGIHTDELRSRKTKYPLAFYRGMIAEQLYERGYTMVSIGKLFGRSHATMIHAIGLLRSLDVPCHRPVRQEYEAFKQLCRAAPSGPMDGIIIHGRVYEYIAPGWCNKCDLKSKCDRILDENGKAVCPALLFDGVVRGYFKRIVGLEKQLNKDE